LDAGGPGPSREWSYSFCRDYCVDKTGGGLEERVHPEFRLCREEDNAAWGRGLLLGKGTGDKQKGKERKGIDEDAVPTSAESACVVTSPRTGGVESDNTRT